MIKRISNLTLDGPYTLFIEAWAEAAMSPNSTMPRCNADGVAGIGQREVTAHVVYMNTDGELGADDYPLLGFYGGMGLVYLGLGILWVTLMACNFRDLLTVQFQIGGVLFLAMMEMALTYGKYDYFNRHGVNSGFLEFGVAVLYAARGTVARLLVLVVSMGYGVVKPRLGPAARQLAAVGVAYFCFAAADAAETNYGVEDTKDPTKQYALRIPLAVLDSAIVWWIFLSLYHTMKILALRQNMVKLSMYQKFRFHLFISVCIAIANVVWTAIAFDSVGGLERSEAWRSFWWNVASWQLIFLFILLGVMFLLRPNMNNARFAYAALETDENSDEGEGEISVVPGFAMQAMTKRSAAANRRTNAAFSVPSAEDDLQWVEENVPTSLLPADQLAGFALDSDEDVVDTRYELSKMQ